MKLKASLAVAQSPVSIFVTLTPDTGKTPEAGQLVTTTGLVTKTISVPVTETTS